MITTMIIPKEGINECLNDLILIEGSIGIKRKFKKWLFKMFLLEILRNIFMLIL